MAPPSGSILYWNFFTNVDMSLHFLDTLVHRETLWTTSLPIYLYILLLLSVATAFSEECWHSDLLPPRQGWRWPRPRGPCLSSRPPEEQLHPTHTPVYLQGAKDHMNTEGVSSNTKRGQLLFITTLLPKKLGCCVKPLRWTNVRPTLYLPLWLGWLCSSPEVQSEAIRCLLGLLTAPARKNMHLYKIADKQCRPWMSWNITHTCRVTWFPKTFFPNACLLMVLSSFRRSASDENHSNHSTATHEISYSTTFTRLH